jgi:hypothetical protein
VTNVDWVEVGRAAHQLVADHGHNAHQYAASLAKVAAAEGRTAEAEFWQAVSDSLRPRGAS